MGNFNTEYNPVKAYSNSEESETKVEKLPLLSPHIPKTNSQIGITLAQSYASLSKALMRIIINNNCNSFCLAVANKQTYVIIWNKPMTKIEEKLNKMHIDLYKSYHLVSLSSTTYAVIFLDAKTQKT